MIRYSCRSYLAVVHKNYGNDPFKNTILLLPRNSGINMGSYIKRQGGTSPDARQKVRIQGLFVS